MIINALARLRLQQSSTQHGTEKEHAFTAGNLNPKYSGVQIVYVPTSPESLLLQGMGNQWNCSTTLIVNNWKTTWPLMVHSAAGGDFEISIWIAVIGYEGIYGNIIGSSTASDFIRAQWCVGDPESTHVKSILLWNSLTRVITNCLWTPNMKLPQRVVINMNTDW